MALFTAVASGNYDDPATWDVGSGYPGASDTFAIGAGFTVTVPEALTVSSTGQLSGSGSDTRGSLVINGNLTLTGNLDLQEYNHVQVNGGGVLDIDGFSLVAATTSSQNSVNSLQIQGTIDNRATLRSSTIGVGDIKYHGPIVLNYADIIDTGEWTVASQFYSGNNTLIEWVVFDGCAHISFGTLCHWDNDWTIRHLDFRNSRSATRYMAKIGINRTSGTSPGIGTQNDISHITAQISGSVDRFEWQLEDMPKHYIVMDRVTDYSVTRSNPLKTKSFTRLNSTDRTIEQGFCSEHRDCYAFSEVDNPHTYILVGSVTRGVIEATYGDGYTDAGDHYILSSSNNRTITDALILEKQTGVLLNALGSDKTAIYEAVNCTLYGNYDAAYGALFRTESGGSVSGSVNMYSNLIYNLGTNTDAWGMNIDNGLEDQVNEMDFNAWWNFGDPYHGATSATKTAGTTGGYGGNDLLDVDPVFNDTSRDFAAWAGFITGTATVDAGVNHLLKLNGYDSSIKSQTSANVINETPMDAIEWVRVGFIAESTSYEDGTGHTGTNNIGMTQVNPEKTVTADSSVVPGATLSVSASGFGGAITTATLTDTADNILPLTNVTDISADVPGLALDQQFCLFGSVTLTISDGEDSATTTLDLNPPANYTHLVTLDANPDTSSTSYLENWTPDNGETNPYEGAQVIATFTIFSDGTFEAPEDGTYQLYAIDDFDGRMQGFELIVGVDDIEDPVITLTGGAVTITQGDEYVEPGYTATDDTDGDITADVVVTGTIDTLTAGTYTLTYTVSDTAGNTTSETRDVVVEAAEGIYSVNGTDVVNPDSNLVAYLNIPALTADQVMKAWILNSGTKYTLKFISDNGDGTFTFKTPATLPLSSKGDSTLTIQILDIGD